MGKFKRLELYWLQLVFRFSPLSLRNQGMQCQYRIRAAYAEAQTSWLTGSNGENATIDKAKKTVTVAKIVTKGTSGTDFSGEGKELPDTNLKNLAEPAAGEHELIFEYNDDGSIKSVAWATGTTMNN